MSNADLIQESDALIAIDARGFIFGTAIAQFIKTSYSSQKTWQITR